MMNDYYILLFRSIINNMVLLQSAEHFALWVVILMMAAQGEYDKTIDNITVHLLPGQVAIKDWRLFYRSPGIDVVNRILEKLKKAEMIEYTIDSNDIYIITISNWDKYQNPSEEIQKIGYIRLYTAILNKEHIMYSPQRLMIWIILLLRGNYKVKQAYFKGEKKMLQPGQCTIGTLELSEKYPVSSATINRTLKIFAELDMIEYEPSSQKSLITINNWELYQELMPYAKNSTIMIKAKDKHKTGNVESTDNQAVCEVLSADNTQNINIVSTDNLPLTDNNYNYIDNKDNSNNINYNENNDNNDNYNNNKGQVVDDHYSSITHFINEYFSLCNMYTLDKIQHYIYIWHNEYGFSDIGIIKAVFNNVDDVIYFPLKYWDSILNNWRYNQQILDSIGISEINACYEHRSAKQKMSELFHIPHKSDIATNYFTKVIEEFMALNH